MLMDAALILKAYALGYELTTGDAWAQEADGHHKDGSFHYKRLARDYNLFKDGKYLTETEDHAELGEFWQSMGGTWGGNFDDGNHYSYGE